MVNVPVLSVQRTSIAPRFWIELSRLTITFFRDMPMAPRDRQTVTIIGSISGVMPTATAIAKKNASFQSSRVLPLVSPLITKTNGTMTSMKRIISQVNLAHAPVEARRDGLGDDRLGHLAEIGSEARLDHDARGAAAFDAGARESRRSSSPLTALVAVRRLGRRIFRPAATRR